MPRQGLIDDPEDRKPVATLYKASGWSNANGPATKRQPHLFYRAEDIDEKFDATIRQYELELRRARALEAFYMSELGMTKPVL